MSDMQDQAAQDSLLKTAASESDSQASSAAQSLSHNSADQSMQPLLRSPCRTLLSNLRGERPNPQQHYKVGIYIRYFNQTKHVDYLDYHVKQYQDTMALCPNWELIDFYIDEGATAPNMESAPEWCRLLQDCFRGKVNLIITQKVSNVSKKDYEITFLARILAALAKHSWHLFCIRRYFYDGFLLSGYPARLGHVPRSLVSPPGQYFRGKSSFSRRTFRCIIRKPDDARSGKRNRSSSDTMW